MTVITEGLVSIFQRVGPDLYRAQLGKAVFDVVEGQLEDVQLPPPAVFNRIFNAGLVHTRHEAFPQFKPFRITVRGVGGFFAMGVNPVLEGVHLGNIGP